MTARSVGTRDPPAPSSFWAARGLSGPCVWLQAQRPVLLLLRPAGLGAGDRGADLGSAAPSSLGASVPPRCSLSSLPSLPVIAQVFPFPSLPFSVTSYLTCQVTVSSFTKRKQ